MQESTHRDVRRIAIRKTNPSCQQTSVTGDSPQMAAGVWVAGLYHPREGEQTVKKRFLMRSTRRAGSTLRLNSSRKCFRLHERGYLFTTTTRYPTGVLTCAYLQECVSSDSDRAAQRHLRTGPRCRCGLKASHLGLIIPPTKTLRAKKSPLRYERANHVQRTWRRRS
jgi:hypothetical protein